jgi:penicillin amidase
MDPAQGYLASANQQPIDPRVAQGWWGGSYDPWRALRINALLRADSSMTPDKMRAFQTDPGSERANRFMPYLVEAARSRSRDTTLAKSADLKEAAAILSAWDRRYTKENTGAALFEEAMRTLPAAVWDELAVDGRRVATPSSGVLLELMADSASVWWDDRSTPIVEHRDDILAETLVRSLDALKSRLGEPGSDGWRWSKLRNANINHLLRLPALSSLHLPVQGGPGTLSPSVGEGTHGPSWRMVVEMGPEVHAWATYPGGQSGNPLSPHYRDHLPLWLRGELEPLRVPHSPNELDATHRRSDVTLTAAH